MRGIIHLDGNKLNTSKDNLMVVNLSELRLFYKMKHKKLSPEYTKAVFLLIRLGNKVKEVADDTKI